MQIAIMNDCDYLDVRDFEAIKAPWDEAGIPIDWSFFLARRGTYKNWRPFTAETEIVKEYIRKGFLKTIHSSIGITLLYRSLLSDIVEEINEPILTGHGRPNKDTPELWLDFTENDVLSSKFFAISYSGGIRYVTKDTRIVSGLFFKRVPPSTKIKITPHFTRLEAQISRMEDHDAILSTHLAHKYARGKHNLYVEHVRKAIKFIDSAGIEVVDVRTFIKNKRKEEPQN
ncbi:unnamed protein product [marine sediment metagenome]|uniref:Uncharacterized protein n=1 Tax=marine sediment metagenome TaxID=412755 RepID=X1T221_9ZZZZ